MNPELEAQRRQKREQLMQEILKAVPVWMVNALKSRDLAMPEQRLNDVLMCVKIVIARNPKLARHKELRLLMPELNSAWCAWLDGRISWDDPGVC